MNMLRTALIILAFASVASLGTARADEHSLGAAADERSNILDSDATMSQMPEFRTMERCKKAKDLIASIVCTKKRAYRCQTKKNGSRCFTCEKGQTPRTNEPLQCDEDKDRDKKGVKGYAVTTVWKDEAIPE